MAVRALRERVDARARIELFAAHLHRTGLRVTTQPLGVFQALAESASHPTVEELYRSVRRRFPHISRTTVYWGLETLQRLGQTAEIWIDREAARFEHAPEPHDHAVCLRYKRIIDIWDPALRKLRLPRGLGRRFRVMSHRVDFVGLCRACWNRPAHPARGVLVVEPEHVDKEGAHGADG